MKYWKITYYNNYCGCDEDFYVMAENEHEADIMGMDYLEEYSFYDPDERFVDMEDEDQVQEYYDNLSYEVKEVSKEEFDEYYR